MASTRHSTNLQIPPPEGLHDRELDPIASVRARPRGDRIDGPIEWHQRLVANPFLAVFGVLAWFLCVRYTVQLRAIRLFFPVAASFLLVILLFEYHCLDCGRTGRLIRSGRHACEQVEFRRTLGRSRTPLWPSAFFQTVTWLVGIVMAAYLIVLARW